MRHSSRLPIVTFLFLSACAAEPPLAPAPPPPPSSPPAPPPAPAPAPAARATRQLADEATLTTATGANFKVPKGWWVTEGGGPIVLEEPDRKLTATIVETPEADALKAIDAAWQLAQPGFARKRLHDPMSPPPVRGWESMTNVDYDVPESEHRAVFAVARRYGGTTFVALVDGDSGAHSRRGAQLDVALWTLRPQGMHEESFAGKTPRPLDAQRARELDAFIDQARERLDVPGAAVAVIQGGKVVYERGTGVRALGSKAAVTPSTLFMMGSITKSMTTMMQAALVDAGKLRWDTPVKELLPTFALADEATTAKLALWHTACACTGMPRRDMELVFEYGKVTPEQRIASMRTMAPTTPFGEAFQYSNLMVAAGGYAAALAYAPKRSFNDAYGAAMQALVFGPLGMKSTTLDMAAARRAEHASPHAEGLDRVPHELPLSEEDFVTPLRPAGGAWSNLRDMERYVMTEIAKGVTPEGKRVVSEANLLERRRPRVTSGELDSYALGLGVGKFRDLPFVSHSGGTFGFGTEMWIFPEQGLAVVSLANTSAGGQFNLVVERKVWELVFEGARPLADARLTFYAKAKRDEIAKAMERVNRQPDAAWVATIAGSYDNADLGRVTISAAPKGGATFDAGEWKTAVGQRRDPDSTLEPVLLDPPLSGMELLVGNDDAHRTLTLLDAQVKYVFTRRGK